MIHSVTGLATPYRPVWTDPVWTDPVWTDRVSPGILRRQQETPR
jgi:hypothetical protein